VHFINYLTFVLFAVVISVEDIKTHKIRNADLLKYLMILLLVQIFCGKVRYQLLAGACMLAIFVMIYLVGSVLPKKAGIGFGDVKLISVMAFGYIEPSFRAFAIFFILLWLALLIHIGMLFIFHRSMHSHVPMAPSIFLATGLYLFTPIAFLLPQ
jgi:Flp pilus assembly protein protease CpaA